MEYNQVGNLISASYRIAGLLNSPEGGISGSQATEGLNTFNSMIDTMKAERLMVYAILRTLVNIVPNRAFYTIGEGQDSTGAYADIQVDRPVRIEQATYLFGSTSPIIEQTMNPLNYQQWIALSPKSLTSSIAYSWYYESTLTNQAGNGPGQFARIYLWPVPTEAGDQFGIYTWESLHGVGGTDEPIYLPPANREMLEYQLAERLADRNPLKQKMSADARARSAQLYAKAKTANNVPLYQQCEAAIRGTESPGHWSIITHDYIGRQ